MRNLIALVGMCALYHHVSQRSSPFYPFPLKTFHTYCTVSDPNMQVSISSRFPAWKFFSLLTGLPRVKPAYSAAMRNLFSSLVSERKWCMQQATPILTFSIFVGCFASELVPAPEIKWPAGILLKRFPPSWYALRFLAPVFCI